MRIDDPFDFFLTSSIKPDKENTKPYHWHRLYCYFPNNSKENTNPINYIFDGGFKLSSIDLFSTNPLQAPIHKTTTTLSDPFSHTPLGPQKNFLASKTQKHFLPTGFWTDTNLFSPTVRTKRALSPCARWSFRRNGASEEDTCGERGMHPPHPDVYSSNIS